jgi:hypothetical protein
LSSGLVDTNGPLLEFHGGYVTATAPDMIEALDRILILLSENKDFTRQEYIQQFTPEDVPQGYEETVSDYFKRLSRDDKEKKKAPVAP